MSSLTVTDYSMKAMSKTTKSQVMAEAYGDLKSPLEELYKYIKENIKITINTVSAYLNVLNLANSSTCNAAFSTWINAKAKFRSSLKMETRGEKCTLAVLKMIIIMA